MYYAKQVSFLVLLVFVFGCAVQQPQQTEEQRKAEQQRWEQATAVYQKAEEERWADFRKGQEELKAERERAAAVAEEKRKVEEERAAREKAQSVPVNVGYMYYRVDQVRWGRKNFGTNTARLEVLLTVCNNDRKARTIPPFTLVDDQGREYESTPELPAEYIISVLDRLNPGVIKYGFVVFDVPSECTYKLKVSGGFWSGEDAYIPLHPTSGS